MRVALNGYFWDQPRTGSGQYLRRLWTALQGLQRPNLGPFTLLLPASVKTEEPVPTSPGFHVAHAPLSPIGGKSANLDKLLWEECGAVRQARRHGASLLHTPYLSAPLLTKMPTIVTAHDMIPWVVPGYRGSAAVQIYLAVAAAGVKRASLILADSDASRRDVIKALRVPARRVRTVYLGVEPHPPYTTEQREEVRARFGLPPAFAFYLGGFDRRKNVPLLLRAWRAFLDSLGENATEGEVPTLAIGGALPEPGGVFPDVRGEARSLGFGGERSPVRFIGCISEEDKPLLMSAARLFVYPSAYEGFGLDPLEAMSVGCPVVSSSGGSLAEVVGGGGLLVPPGDEAAMQRAIAHGWHDEALREELKGRGVAQAARFTWDGTARLTLGMYEEATSKERGRVRR